MKITHLSSLPAVTNLVVTRFDVASRRPFSGSGTFTTIPGDEGPHFIEAYNSTAVVGQTPPFAVGPTYMVLPPGSTAGPTSTTITTSLPNTSLPPTVATPTTPTLSTPRPSTQNFNFAPTQGASVAPDPSTPSTFSNPTTGTSQSPTSTPPQSSIIIYESGVGSISTIVIEPPTLSGPTSNALPSEAKSLNISAIIGAAVGGAAVVAVIIFLLVVRRKRQKPRAGALISNSPTAIDPFLSFSANPNEKHLGGLTEPSYSARTSVSPSESRSSRKTFSDSTDSISRVDPGIMAGMISGPQMEWVLRPTNDPPPGYNLAV
ncbi:hypothetical protein DFH09DRAFT_1143373 [Mycena vulgaris]|nr:hypothetical protein DFH09DRAFT_1143373 [Mycena vulgaris]